MNGNASSVISRWKQERENHKINPDSCDLTRFAFHEIIPIPVLIVLEKRSIYLGL